MPLPLAICAATQTNSWLRRGLFVAASAMALLAGGAFSLTKQFQTGATSVFSRVIDAVKDHPQATIALSLVGIALVWFTIGVIVAGQEFWDLDRTPRKKC